MNFPVVIMVPGMAEGVDEAYIRQVYESTVARGGQIPVTHGHEVAATNDFSGIVGRDVPGTLKLMDDGKLVCELEVDDAYGESLQRLLGMNITPNVSVGIVEWEGKPVIGHIAFVVNGYCNDGMGCGVITNVNASASSAGGEGVQPIEARVSTVRVFGGGYVCPDQKRGEWMENDVENDESKVVEQAAADGESTVEAPAETVEAAKTSTADAEENESLGEIEALRAELAEREAEINQLEAMLDEREKELRAMYTCDIKQVFGAEAPDGGKPLEEMTLGELRSVRAYALTVKERFSTDRLSGKGDKPMSRIDEVLAKHKDVPHNIR